MSIAELQASANDLDESLFFYSRSYACSHTCSLVSFGCQNPVNQGGRLDHFLPAWWFFVDRAAFNRKSSCGLEWCTGEFIFHPKCLLDLEFLEKFSWSLPESGQRMWKRFKLSWESGGVFWDRQEEIRLSIPIKPDGRSPTIELQSFDSKLLRITSNSFEFVSFALS